MQCPSCLKIVANELQRCSHCGAQLPPPPGESATRPAAGQSRDHSDFPPGCGFAHRFVIIEKAGTGGMGVVYKALDRVLNQEVALKLIHPALGQIPSFVERFKREVRVTRQIHHPNVCRVHDLGEDNGLMYQSMEWIHGETLQELLSHAGRLNHERALEIAEKIASALDAAHSKGVVHRDLKPGNVMIDERGEIVVLDFGLATEPDSAPLTELDIVQGTPLYMAPEQRWGGKVDGRADLYSLGLILQQMLTGRLPEPEQGAAARISEHVDRQLVPILVKLLADDREQRYPSAEMVAQILRDLRTRGAPAPTRYAWREWIRGRRWTLWAVGAVGLGAVLVAAVFLLRPRPEPVSEAQVFYERGLHYLREEAETLQSLDDAIHMFHRAIGVDSSFALAWAGLGEAYWTRFDRFDRSKQASSRPEGERAVRRALELDPNLPEARNAKARGLIAEGDYREAKEELKKALGRKPNLDAAWANLGRAHQSLAEYSEGLVAVKRAIKLNPTSFRHYISLGNFYLRSGEYREAEKAYRKAIALKPESPLAWRNLGAVLLFKGESKEAAEALVQSLRMEESARSRTNLAIAYQYLGRYGEAVAQCRLATEQEPDNAVHWGALGDALTLQGQGEEAKHAYDTAVRLARDKVESTPRDPSAHGSLALWCAKAGDLPCASSEGARAMQMLPDDARILLANAVVRCAAGRDEEALELLERASRLGLGRYEIEMDPALLRLHRLPRFKRILELMS